MSLFYTDELTIINITQDDQFNDDTYSTPIKKECRYRNSATVVPSSSGQQVMAKGSYIVEGNFIANVGDQILLSKFKGVETDVTKYDIVIRVEKPGVHSIHHTEIYV